MTQDQFQTTVLQLLHDNAERWKNQEKFNQKIEAFMIEQQRVNQEFFEFRDSTIDEFCILNRELQDFKAEQRTINHQLVQMIQEGFEELSDKIEDLRQDFKAHLVMYHR